MSEDIFEVTDATFEEEIVKSEMPVLLDFWAVWCGPCKIIVPSLENIAKDYKGRLKVAKMNVDESPMTPSKFSVMSIPTLLLFKGGEIKETIIGALPQKKIEEAINKHL
ncbi:MAG: thioredoxin [Candidatus Aminicenantes bacterium]|jgi:thioredoxin 1|nr:thioredoxin [Candidatus Aminicenantes bacterium]